MSSNVENVKIDVETPPTTDFKVKYLVEGMTCSSCVSTVENGVKNSFKTNLKRVEVNLLEDTMEVVFSEENMAQAKIYSATIADTVECLGFDCKVLGVKNIVDGKQRKLLTCLFTFQLKRPVKPKNGTSRKTSLEDLIN